MGHEAFCLGRYSLFGMSKDAVQRDPAPTAEPQLGGRSISGGSLPENASTPAMRQYHAFKQRHPDCLLFFRMGDFYEMFYEDAVTAHKVLGITLTERTRGVPMAGVPYHAAENYLRRLIAQGYRVAVADQMQEAAQARGVIERAVTRVVTPGTLVDESLLEAGKSNHIAAVLFTGMGADSPACLAIAELSTGTFELFDIEPAKSQEGDPGGMAADAAAGEIIDQMLRLGVDELLFAQTATGETPPRVKSLERKLKAVAGSACALNPRPSWHFRQAEALETLQKHFGVRTLSGWGLSESDPAVGAAGALLRYLLETQNSPGNESAATARLVHLRPPRRRSICQYVAIDAVSFRSLEIERTMHAGAVAGSLLGRLQNCATPMGRRLLRDWLCFPLRDVAAIKERQDAVAAFLADQTLSRRFADLAGDIQDVARIAGRMALNRATPRDLVALARSIRPITELVDLFGNGTTLAGFHRRLAPLSSPLSPLADEILAACVSHPPSHMRDGGLINDGFDAELDESRTLTHDATSWIAAYQQRLIGETGIASLKVGFNSVFGYYIEITNAHAARVPATFARKQTLKNAERYITPELKEYESRVTSAQDRALAREQAIFAGLCARCASLAPVLSDYATVIAELDVLASFADRARRRGFVRPTIVEEPVIQIRGGRHPVLDELLLDKFVPNDTIIGADPDSGTVAPALCLITGPNMAGKSTFIRQTALLVLLAHTGAFIPAEAARIGLVDRVFTRIGASDELHAGRSTFMVEMTETANILHHATDRSLVILDEIGRGTSTLDGLSLAWAIAEQLAQMGTRTLFATHYHELTQIADLMPSRVGNAHVSVREWNDEIIFLYRILPGSTDRSYGIHVAKIAGIPRAVVERAQELLNTLEVNTAAHSSEASGESPTAPRKGQAPIGQMNLFVEYLENPALVELRKSDLNSMSPMQAFELVRRMKELVDPIRSP